MFHKWKERFINLKHVKKVQNYTNLLKDCSHSVTDISVSKAIKTNHMFTFNSFC